MKTKKALNYYNKSLEKVTIGIREVSEITGAPVRKLRYWKDKGIITSAIRMQSGRQFFIRCKK